MFKGKKAIYILIPVNIAVWGFFIYRFYTAYNNYDELPLTEKIANFKLDELKDSVNYQLALSYKDPFLKDVEKPKNYSNKQENKTENNSSHTPKNNIVAKTPTIAVKPTFEVKYLGLIKTGLK